MAASRSGTRRSRRRSWRRAIACTRPPLTSRFAPFYPLPYIRPIFHPLYCCKCIMNFELKQSAHLPVSCSPRTIARATARRVPRWSRVRSTRASRAALRRALRPRRSAASAASSTLLAPSSAASAATSSSKPALLIAPSRQSV